MGSYNQLTQLRSWNHYYWPDKILPINQHPETVTTGQMRSCRSTHILKLTDWLNPAGQPASWNLYYWPDEIYWPDCILSIDQPASWIYWTDWILQVNSHLETWIYWTDWILPINSHLEIIGLIESYSQPIQLRFWNRYYWPDGILQVNQHPETFIIDLMRFTGPIGSCRSTHIFKLSDRWYPADQPTSWNLYYWPDEIYWPDGNLQPTNTIEILKPLLLDKWDPTGQPASWNCYYWPDGILQPTNTIEILKPLLLAW